jgi:hypothetical protein
LAVIFMLGVGVMAFAVGPAAAVGDNTSHLDREVSGPLHGSSTFDFSTPRCSFVHQTYDATYTATTVGHHHGHGAFHLDGCVALSSTFPFTGRFTLTTVEGARLTGTVSGTIPMNNTGACSTPLVEGQLAFTLTVAQGTREFGDVTGTIALTGTWCSPAVPSTPGPINGTLAGHLAPSKK